MQRILTVLLPIYIFLSIFNFSVFADEDDSFNQGVTVPAASSTNSTQTNNTTGGSLSCSQGNCSACATQTISACGNQNAYGGDCDYATACKNNPNGKYTCRSRENPNGCYFDQYDCSVCNSSITGSGVINSIITTPQPKSGVTDIDKLGDQCAQDCGKCTKRYDYNLKEYTYDTCVDDKGQSNIGNPQIFCKNGATKFRCFASANKNCVSDLEGSYSYSCQPVNASPGSEPVSSPTPKPLTLASVLLDISTASKTTLGVNFAQNIALPFADLTKESNLPAKFDVTYSDGSTKSFFLTFKYKPKPVSTPTPIPTASEIPAKGNETGNRNFTCLQNSGLPIKVPVLVLEYYPPDSGNPNLLDGIETGWKGDAQINGRTIKFWEEKTQEMINKGIALVNEATRYHGYKDQNAIQFLSYTVLDRKKFYSPMPRGFVLEKKQNGDATRPDYGKILRDQNICDYVDNKGVKEVWMYGYHNDNGITPDESKMSSRYGDVSNGQPKEEGLPQQYRMPICKNSYVLYNFTYNPDGNPGNNLHNRMHQIENIIPFAEGPAFWPMKIWKGSDNSKGSTFWGNFSEVPNEFTGLATISGDRKVGFRSSCGNAHIAPNWTNTKNQEYRYDLNTQGEFNCETWHPDLSRTTYIKASCERWGCTDVGFYKWYMQNIPGYNNGIVYQGKSMRNWWEAMYDFNAFIDKGRSLYGGSIFCDIKANPEFGVASIKLNTRNVKNIIDQYGEGAHDQETQP